MDAEKAWQSLIAESSEKPILLKTKTGLNFKLTTDGRILIVDKSEINPSSKIKSPRTIYKNNFIKVFSYYDRWANNEKGISKEITAITVNSVYIMAAIAYKL